jgi:hypothetical protein
MNIGGTLSVVGAFLFGLGIIAVLNSLLLRRLRRYTQASAYLIGGGVFVFGLAFLARGMIAPAVVYELVGLAQIGFNYWLGRRAKRRTMRRRS